MTKEPANGTASSAVTELQEFEASLCRLSGVVAARVVGDRAGRPIEIHVVADQRKPSKQTVRDVRALAQTVFGMDIDHRIVSVAQLDATGSLEQSAGPAAASRVRLIDARVEVEGVRAMARITLVGGMNEITGFAEGSAASMARPRLVAQATLDALRQLEHDVDSLYVDTATLGPLASHEVATVALVFVEPPLEHVVSGSAVVRRDPDEAIARAVLDATNRRLSAGASERRLSY
jgi:hypothetical protein